MQNIVSFPSSSAHYFILERTTEWYMFSRMSSLTLNLEKVFYTLVYNVAMIELVRGGESCYFFTVSWSCWRALRSATNVSTLLEMVIIRGATKRLRLALNKRCMLFVSPLSNITFTSDLIATCIHLWAILVMESFTHQHYLRFRTNSGDLCKFPTWDMS